MRDRNEATPEAAGASLVPIPIGLVPLIKIRKWRRFLFAIHRDKRRIVLREPYIEERRGMIWNPKELHRFWRRILGEDGK